ncbi:MAG: DUF885 domain-containing protein [Egibacteraceae bacterium]
MRDHSPTTATRLGDHARDDELDDWGPGAVDERLRELSGLQRRLADVHLEPGVPDDVELDGDRMLLDDTLAGMRLELDVLRLPETDPTFYLGIATDGVYDLLRRDDLPVGPRRAAAARRVAAVPRLLDQARANLTGVTAPRRQVTLLRAPGAATLFRDVVPAFAPQAALAGQAAAQACEAFALWLGTGEGAVVPDWPLGEGTWSEALRLVLGSRLPAEELWQRGWVRLDELQAEAEQLARAVLSGGGPPPTGDGPAPTGDPRALVWTALDRLAADRSPRERLVADAAAGLDDIVGFLRSSDLFDLPEPDVLRVEEVPAFQQGVAMAYFMPAPPLEPEAPHTYYLSPVPADWDDERATSFLREYNHHGLASVGLHEAYPGHYVHFAAAQRHPRRLRRTLWNSACAEGWAVYAEREVVRAGFGGPGLALTNVKMDMRAVANALLDQGLHVHGWDDDTAMALLTDRVYQERSEAEGKLVRAKVTAGQLSSYFVGGEEFADLRTDVAAARGSAFHPRAFHADVLAQGVPPVGVLRRALGVQPAA